MSYAVKEIYYTIQGEGAQSGRPAIFADLRVAIFGRNGKKIERRRPAGFAIRISSAPMAQAVASSHLLRSWHGR